MKANVYSAKFIEKYSSECDRFFILSETLW